jgi:hypothetical protein
MTILAHFIAISSNRKIGAIPCTYSARFTCPDSCPLKKAGCYAEDFRTAMLWNKVDSGKLGKEWEAFCEDIRTIKTGQLWRHNVAGDLPPIDTDTIDADKLAQLVDANKGRNGFTYTHYPDTEHNIDAIRNATENGFTINLSGNNLDHAADLARHGLPVVAIVPIDYPTETTYYKGHKVITCPATYRDEVTCATCKLCQVSKRGSIVAFPAHGSKKRMVNESLIIARSAA